MNAHHDYRTLIWSTLAKPTPRLVTAVIIFVDGYVLAVWISRVVQRMLIRSERIARIPGDFRPFSAMSMNR